MKDDLSFRSKLGSFIDALSPSVKHPASEASAALACILVIDDDPALRTAIGSALESSYRVITCGSAKDGISKLTDEISAVVLDIRMPEMDGFTLYRLLREKDPDVPILFHSAYQDLKDPFEILNEYRPFGYVTKGTNISILLQMVAAAVRHRERLNRHHNLLKELHDVRSQLDAVMQRTRPR